MRYLARIAWKMEQMERSGGWRQVEAELPWICLLIAGYALLLRYFG